MRNAFADELTRLAADDPRIVMLSGDIGNRLFDAFKKVRPDNFFNCGVAEANMTGVATGMALTGLRPVIYTIAPFATTRCLEQIRTDACYHEAPVVIVGVGGGLAYAGLGPTHHACEDIALLRALPNMAVVCPGDPWEVRASLRAALARDLPTYIRLGKKGEPSVHTDMPKDFAIGQALVVRGGSDACLLVTGNLLPEAMTAAEQLEKQGISTEVVSFHTVKPLDVAFLARCMNRFRVVASVEEHSRIGGFGAAVAEWIADTGVRPQRFLRLATPDAFFKLAGEQEFARATLGIDAEHIADAVHSALNEVVP